MYLTNRISYKEQNSQRFLRLFSVDSISKVFFDIWVCYGRSKGFLYSCFEEFSRLQLLKVYCFFIMVSLLHILILKNVSFLIYFTVKVNEENYHLQHRTSSHTSLLNCVLTCSRANVSCVFTCSPVNLQCVLTYQFSLRAYV